VRASFFVVQPDALDGSLTTRRRHSCIGASQENAMSITPGASGDRDAASARLTPRPPGAPGTSGVDNLRGFSGGNLVGAEASGLDEVRGIEPGEGSLLDRDVPIGSALIDAQRQPPGAPSGAGHASDSGPQTLGPTSGGERASAGTAPNARSSRTDDNTLQSRSDGLE
jgi:hypothetical protein